MEPHDKWSSIYFPPQMDELQWQREYGEAEYGEDEYSEEEQMLALSEMCNQLPLDRQEAFAKSVAFDFIKLMNRRDMNSARQVRLEHYQADELAGVY